MGIGPGYRSSCSCTSTVVYKERPGNPNPTNFKIEKLGEVGDWVYTEVRYPDCTNFEGLKVLVFYKVPAEDIMRAKEIDPHFCDNTHIKPIARFEPTEFGKMLAWQMVKSGGEFKGYERTLWQD